MNSNTNKSNANIKWPIAKTLNGAYINIQEATTGEVYHCPECSNRFVARKGKSVRWHFAHYPGVLCSGEGSRHAVAKHQIAAKLGKPHSMHLYCSHHLRTQQSFEFTFTEVKTEDTVEGYRVDVTCKLKEKLLCIEVIDSNSINPEKKAVLEDMLVEVPIKGLNNDTIFEGKELHSKLRDQLRVHIAHRFGYFVHIWTSHCSHCGKEINVAIVCSGDIMRNPFHPRVLSQFGKNIKIEWQTTIGRKGFYVAICSHCRARINNSVLKQEFAERTSLLSSTSVKTVFKQYVKYAK